MSAKEESAEEYKTNGTQREEAPSFEKEEVKIEDQVLHVEIKENSEPKKANDKNEAATGAGWEVPEDVLREF